MFLSAQLPVSLQISSLAKLIHLSPFQRRSAGGGGGNGGGGLNVRRYANASEDEMKTSRARRICSTFVSLCSQFRSLGVVF